MPQDRGSGDVPTDGDHERPGIRCKALGGGTPAAVREDGLLSGDQRPDMGLEW